MVKNTAYAWRQMVFYLGLLSTQDVAGFVQWAERHLARQPENFRIRFRPVLDGLVQVTNGQSLGSGAVDAAIARRFLGWSDAAHWLLADTSQ
ncbi:hypothetical protein WM16_16545 [Burkholderia ubonensis]|uniref:Uncharacterized protein n=1 Tax=Burkholderia ubonensis TaxID=101571 RepID=A0A108CEM7_9BURK|nr:hypothetical protein [Burkholderia ubonensis]KWK73201.1 hypothetical protein WM16_16545 [Burkholderia ubonensis]